MTAGEINIIALETTTFNVLMARGANQSTSQPINQSSFAGLVDFKGYIFDKRSWFVLEDAFVQVFRANRENLSES